jgi:hypothetical protein
MLSLLTLPRLIIFLRLEAFSKRNNILNIIVYVFIQIRVEVSNTP